MPRLMIISHGHPEFSHGGAEVAAYAIHALISNGKMPGWDSVFVSYADRARLGHDGEVGAFRGRANEVLVHTPPMDGFFFESRDRSKLFGHLQNLVDHFRPDVVHMHHFSYWGLDVIDFFREAGIPVVLTLHEYLSICNNFGQMVKTGGRLCHVSSPAECHACFPAITSGMFFLRDELFKRHFAGATTLVSPSRFLADRIAAWSDGACAPVVIENPRDLSRYEPAANAPARRDAGALTLGYFGQVNHFKGIDVLLEAVSTLRKRGQRVNCRLYGANLNIQEDAFRQRIMARLEELDGAVEFFGPYQNASVIRLMADCDAIVMPSIWWENSPVVLQEAMQAGVPIFASRLGGIEEKLRDYPKTIFFEVGSASDLARKVENHLDAPSAPADQPAMAQANDAHWAALTQLYRSTLEHSGKAHVGLELLRSSKETEKPRQKDDVRRDRLSAGRRRSAS